MYTKLELQDKNVELMGYVIVRDSTARDKEVVIEYMEVVQEYRKRGVAKKLLAMVVRLFPDCTIHAWVELQYLHPMYLAHGFTVKRTYAWSEDGGGLGVQFHRQPNENVVRCQCWSEEPQEDRLQECTGLDE